MLVLVAPDANTANIAAFLTAGTSLLIVLFTYAKVQRPQQTATQRET